MRIFADFTGIFTTICLKHNISVIEIMFVPDIVPVFRKRKILFVISSD